MAFGFRNFCHFAYLADARQLSSGEVEVGEGQQREHLCPVLDDAAIAHLAIAKLAFHDTEDMLDLGADRAFLSVAFLL